jgi:hypothetical protein
MVDPTMQQILAQLAEQAARLAAQDAKVAALEGRLARGARGARRGHRARRAPALLVALLVALVPLSLLAATPFTDLNPGSVHNPNIDALYAAGVTRGCVPDQEYCPNAGVTREEMASFLARLGGLGSNPPVANAKTAVNATNATNAQSAQTAQDAAQLGGQPASAYLRRGAADFAFLGQHNLAGPLPTTRTFTSHGGSLLVFASGTAYSSAAGYLIGVNVIVDGKIVGVLQGAASEAQSHKALPSVAAVVRQLPAGTHTITFDHAPVFPATKTDLYDLYSLTILELPIP